MEHFSDFNASQTALRERKEYSATLAQIMACLITGSYKKSIIKVTYAWKTGMALGEVSGEG
jgi:hypothetical protein